MSPVIDHSDAYETQLTLKGNLLTASEIVLTRNIGFRIFTTIVIDVNECVRPVLSRSRREHVGMCEGCRSHYDDGKEFAEHHGKG